jgi:DNA-binding transcriptional LysR family regulator
MSSADEMRVFARVVARGSFSSAAEDLELSPSAVSKLVTRLEARLGARLFHRTTRRLSLTPEGEAYHLRAQSILAAIDDAEAEVSRSQTPQGRLRVNSIVPFVVQLTAALPDFAARYPTVQVELTASDRIVDLLAENADVGIRTGAISDASLVVRKIATVERHIYASPKYLARRGTPLSSDELADHDCITITTIAGGNRWLFKESGKTRTVEIAVGIMVDNSEAALQVAIAGGGIIRIGDVVAADAVREGRLVQLFAENHLVEPVQLSAVYPLGRQGMPKVRVFIDFLVERFRHAPWRQRASAV